MIAIDGRGACMAGYNDSMCTQLHVLNLLEYKVRKYMDTAVSGGYVDTIDRTTCGARRGEGRGSDVAVYHQAVEQNLYDIVFICGFVCGFTTGTCSYRKVGPNFLATAPFLR